MKFTILLFSSVFLVLPGCSLNYGKLENTETAVPELTFSNAQLNKYKSNRLTAQIEAERIEQYKNQQVSFARSAAFHTWNDQGEPSLSGSCGLLAADSGTDQYSLFNKIDVTLYSQKIQLQAESLRWNGKTEQLTSSKNTPVVISRDNFIVSGTGFSASAVSRSFVFTGNAHGTITDKTDDPAGAPQ
jgi:LPS export ABC transporter protein LptC